MAIAGSRVAIIAVLVIVGLYFLLFHKDLPLNHEYIGLGTGEIFSITHIVHDIIGIILLGGAVLVWRKSRTVSMPAAAAKTVKP